MCISFVCVFLCFYVLFAMCVNGLLWTDFQINGMEWSGLVTENIQGGPQMTPFLYAL